MLHLSLVLVAFFGLVAFAATAVAQVSVPATYFGSVTIDGQLAAEGTEVRGFVGDLDCSQAPPGEHTVIRDGDTAAYVLTVVHDSQRAGCAREDSLVTFTIGGRAAVQTARWKPGPMHIDLSSGAAPAIPLPSPTGTLAAALPTETPAASAPASSSPPTLARPTGTPPTDDVHFDQTQGPAKPPASGSDSDDGGSSAFPYVAGALILVGGGAAAGGFALARRRRPPPMA